MIPPAPDRPTPDLAALIGQVIALAVEAGELILGHYRTEFDVEHKDDRSPVTVADNEANALIVAGLKRIAPDIPVIAEESVEAGDVPDVSGGIFWLVDPLDGTKEFINKRDEFTVNIALVIDRRPVLGVVHTPAQDRLYAGYGPGTATRRKPRGVPTPISARVPPREGIVVAASRSHANAEALDDFLDGRAVTDRIVAGSALKFCLVAEGTADLYPRFGTTMEWDTAAGHAVLNAAGGSVLTTEGGDFLYAKPEFRNPHFIARGRED